MDQQTQYKLYNRLFFSSFLPLFSFFFAAIALKLNYISFVVGNLIFFASLILYYFLIFSHAMVGGLWQGVTSKIWRICTYSMLMGFIITFIFGLFERGFFILVLPCMLLTAVGVYHPMPEEGLCFSGLEWKNKFMIHMFRSRVGAVFLILCALVLLGVSVAIYLKH